MLWRKVGAEELIYRRQVHGQRIHLAFRDRFDFMVIRHHLAETIDVLPDMLMLRVKNVRPIGMHHHTCFVASRVAVSGDMIAGVKNN